MEAFTSSWAGFGALTWLGIGAALLAEPLLTGTAYLLWIAGCGSHRGTGFPIPRCQPALTIGGFCLVCFGNDGRRTAFL